MDEAGEKVDCVRINNDPVWFAEEVSTAPNGCDVVIEATYGWYWAVAHGLDRTAGSGRRILQRHPTFPDQADSLEANLGRVGRRDSPGHDGLLSARRNIVPSAKPRSSLGVRGSRVTPLQSPAGVVV